MKKIFAAVLALGIIGGILGGCQSDNAGGGATAGDTAGTAGTAGTTGTTG